jgi:DNA/RNA endonuclease G (NUC1)
MKKLLLLLLIPCGIVNAQIILKKSAYTIYYDTILKAPTSSFYIFTARNLIHVVGRSASFHAETEIPKRLQASKKDYAKPWDIGHLVPDADMRFDSLAEKECMTFANTAHQFNAMNEVQWRLIENYVRGLGDQYDSLFIFTGCIYNKNYRTIGNEIAIPDFYFKTIHIKNNGKTVGGLAFICSNKPQASKDISTFIVSIGEIEQMVKIDLYKGNNAFELEKTLIK